jgi:uridine kinase
LQPLIIGVAGGSGSGKTTVVEHIIDAIGRENVLLIQHDSYYRDLSHMSFEERTKQNFDHPSALETDLMIRHLKMLSSGSSIEIPIYDFKKHVRKDETRHASPRKIILIDGILIFTEQELRRQIDIKLYVDTDDDIRLLRRIKRDIVERDRDLKNILEQYQRYVRPMHLEFVEPTKRYADVIIPHGGENEVALDMVIARIEERLMDNSPTNRE